MAKISVVINTWNEEKNLPRALASIRELADEIIVVDMQSHDNTIEIAKKAGAKVFSHKQTGYVEPARNFAISKASGDWVLILDADEEIPDRLVKKIRQLIKKPEADFYRLPRKNIIFGKWIRHSGWWPDYQIRLFRNGSVVWSELIHSVPETRGTGFDVSAQEQLAIVHHNYQTLSQFMSRVDRYTTIQAKTKNKEDYRFNWRDLVVKPTGEFVTRFFVAEGYKDGTHGLALALLQAFSELLIYMKIWESEKFKEQSFNSAEIENAITQVGGQIDYWLVVKKMRRLTVFTKLLRRISK